MFKRFQVIELFHSDNADKEVSEWVEIDGKHYPRNDRGIYKVKLENGDQTTAYYCSDGCAGLVRYFKDTLPCKWWERDTKTPLQGVTHWGKHD